MAGSNTIGSLVIDLVANTANFSTQLNSARKAVEDFASDIKAVVGGLGGAFSIAGIAELTKDILSFGDELQKSAAKTSVGVTALSELSFAAKQANIDLPELTSSFDRMEKSISTATTSTGNSKQAFDALGLSLDTLKGLSPDQQFEAIAEQISKLPDPADKARASIEIFGRAGADLLPLFEQGAAGIEAARQKAVEFGASLDSDQVRKLADANTAVKDLGAAFGALGTALVAKVAPGLTGFVNSLTDLVTNNQVAILTREIAGLQEQLSYAETSNFATSPEVTQLQGQILKAEMALQSVQLAKQIRDSLASGGAGLDISAQPPGYLPDIQPIQVNPNLKIQGDPVLQFYKDLDDATKTATERLADDQAKLDEQLKKLMNPDPGSGFTPITSSEYFNRLFNSQDDAQEIPAFFSNLQSQIQASIQGSQKDLSASFDAMAQQSKASSDQMKKDFEATANYAVQTGKAIQDSFAEAFDDIGTKGLGGLVADFLNAFRKILDQAAAFDLAKMLGINAAFQNQGSGSALGSIFSGIGSLFGAKGGGGTDLSTAATIGFATGGSWMVGGHGGTDSQLVAFRASPDESVTVQTPSQRAAGGKSVVFSPVYNFGSGVSRTDVIQACSATQASTIARMTELIRGGAYA